jgi:hypothetical protein
MCNVKTLFEEYVEVATIVSKYLVDFERLLDIEFQLIEVIKTSGYTKKIAETRKRVSRDLTGINKVVNSALRHFDPVVVRAAQSIELRLKPITSVSWKKTYSELAGGVLVLINDLNTLFRPQVTTLGLETWIKELTEAHSAFVQLLELRNNEHAARPKPDLKTIRKQIDAVYRKMVEHIDSYSIASDPSICKQFIERLNAKVVYFNNQYKYRATISIKKAFVSSIPVQTFDDGHPATPIPEVFYDDKKLVFSVDYELSYKNNSRPGSAMVYIHGKGTFKGVLAISFTIKNKES